MSYQKHPFHLVDPSPWPLFSAFGAFTSTFGAVTWFHGFESGALTLCTGQIMLLYGMFVWFRDIVREGTYQGHHTRQVQKGLKMGMVLFIISEIMFFVSFFWAFFHSALAPTVEIGCAWPPIGIQVLNPWDIPMLNTIILLTSGVTCTAAHYALYEKAQDRAKISLLLTILLGTIFTGFQVKEYLEAPFSLNDGIYGSTFFMATGFHGFHILIGTIFLIVCLVRIHKGHFFAFYFNKNHKTAAYPTGKREWIGFECAAMYWHFVDVVWLFLFAFIYWWGGSDLDFDCFMVVKDAWESFQAK